MDKELIEELNEFRVEMGMPEEDFVQIMSLAEMHRDNSKILITDEMLYEIIREAMASYDYEQEVVDKQSAIEAIRLLIEDERKERHFSDEELFAYIKEYLDIIEGRKGEAATNRKTPEEMVERAVRSLGMK